MISSPVSFARIEHGQANQKLTIRARGYNKKKNALNEAAQLGGHPH
jgi:hypothetical protein